MDFYFQLGEEARIEPVEGFNSAGIFDRIAIHYEIARSVQNDCGYVPFLSQFGSVERRPFFRGAIVQAQRVVNVRSSRKEMLPDNENFAVADVAKMISFPHAIRGGAGLGGRGCCIETKNQDRKVAGAPRIFFPFIQSSPRWVATQGVRLIMMAVRSSFCSVPPENSTTARYR